MSNVRIESDYKVTIPKDARDALDLKSGEEVETITRKDSITFRRVKAARFYTPTKRELAAIEKGRAEIKEGKYYSLDELHTSLAGHHRAPRAKAPRSRS